MTNNMNTLDEVIERLNEDINICKKENEFRFASDIQSLINHVKEAAEKVDESIIKQAIAERDAEILEIIDKAERNIIKLVSDEHTAKATIKYIATKIKELP